MGRRRRPGTSPGTRHVVAEREPRKTALAPPAVKARLRPTTTLGNPTVAHIPAGRTHLRRPRRCRGHSGAGIRGLRQPGQITPARRHRQHASRGARGPGPDRGHSVTSAYNAAPIGITTGRGAYRRASARAGNPVRPRHRQASRSRKGHCGATARHRAAPGQPADEASAKPTTAGHPCPRHRPCPRGSNCSGLTATCGGTGTTIAVEMALEEDHHLR
jgi:hypothetical protein